MVNKSSYVLAFFAMIFLAISFASASIEVSGELEKTALHGTTISGYLTIINEDTTNNYTNISIISLNSNLTFPSFSNFSLNKSDSKNITYQIVIPQYKIAEDYPYSFKITYNDSDSIKTITKEIIIKVNESKSLSIEDKIISENDNSTKIKITNNGNTNRDVSLSIANDTIKYSVANSSLTIAPGEAKEFLVYVDSSAVSTTRMSSYTNTISILEDSVSVGTGKITFEKTYCRSGEKINDIKISSVEDRSSGDDWEWEPLKEIRLRIELDNLADTSKKAVVKIGLYNVNDNKFIEISEDSKEIEEAVRISSNDDARLDVAFVLPADFNMNDEYRLYVKAYESGKESSACTSKFDGAFYKQIIMDSDNDILVDQIEFPKLLTCGSTNTVSFRVFNFNLGDEELMRVGLYNKELGINIVSSQFELDEGENEEVSFDLRIPSNAAQKIYRFTIFADYDYRESSDNYRRSVDIQTISLNIQGSECTDSARPVISAKLESSAIVGEDLVVAVTFKNNGNTSVSAIITPEDYESWAELVSSAETITVDKSESKIVYFTFKPTKAGQQTFNLNVIYSGKSIDQPVTVIIEANTSWMSSIKEQFGAVGAYLIVGIVALIALIILVLVIKLIIGFARKH